MLVQLSVSNFALIESATVELHTGFNVVTGETGAGKSMLAAALGLVLGGRGNPEMVRTGTREAEASALFDISEHRVVRGMLEASGIPCDDELVLRRTVQAEGRSRAFVNGRLCTLSQLAELGRALCDVASQHESVGLTDASNHGPTLDAFASLVPQREALEAKVKELAAVGAERERIQARIASKASREAELEATLSAMRALDPKLGEEHELEQERERLRHAERLRESTRTSADRLVDGDEPLVDVLGRVCGELRGAAAVDPELVPIEGVIEVCRTELMEAARQLRRYAASVDASPGRLSEVEERLFELRRLLRAFGPSTQELLAHRERLEEELRALGESDGALAGVDARFSALRAECMQLALALSAERVRAALGLSRSISRELAQLGMPKSRFLVSVTKSPPVASDPLSSSEARLSPSGIDRVEFLLAANAGEEPRGLARVASGGELSRALLAMKRVLVRATGPSVYVFDEVDTGVGGAVAEVMGRAIRDIAKHRQVLCITHLPQVAAQADAHILVGKAEKSGRTVTTLRRLKRSERVAELARMIGGVKVTQAARTTAEEMLATG
jgi:DNA repair protein RecN (Recombination protein N)